MEFIEVIEERRSTREFEEKKIAKEKIESLIECARLAPSAKNRQPWYFVVVENQKKNEIADIMSRQLSSHVIEDLKKDGPTNPHNPASSVKASIKIIKQAPILILVFRDPDDIWKEGDYLSIGCAVEHLCLRATDLGLGSLWIRDVVYTRREIASFVNKDNVELVTAVAIGYSCEFPYTRKKKQLIDIMEWYENEK